MLQLLRVFDPIVIFLELLHFTDQSHNILVAKCNIITLNYCEFHTDFVNKIDYEQSLFFLGPSSKTCEIRK